MITHNTIVYTQARLDNPIFNVHAILYNLLFSVIIQMCEQPKAPFKSDITTSDCHIYIFD